MIGFAVEFAEFAPGSAQTSHVISWQRAGICPVNGPRRCFGVKIKRARRLQATALGIVSIAATSDGQVMAGRRVNRYRLRQQALRRKLQAKGTRSAKRLLKKRARREARFARDANHCIAKKIVAEAERTCRGIALEDLTGIRDRARLRRPQRVMLNSWSFAQLGSFIGYKARRAGVPVVYVDPAWTSRTCADCGHAGKRNRVTQAMFICRGCGVVAHADRNASRNIAARGMAAWDAGRESRAPAPARHG